MSVSLFVCVWLFECEFVYVSLIVCVSEFLCVWVFFVLLHQSQCLSLACLCVCLHASVFDIFFEVCSSLVCLCLFVCAYLCVCLHMCMFASLHSLHSFVCVCLTACLCVSVWLYASVHWALWLRGGVWAAKAFIFNQQLTECSAALPGGSEENRESNKSERGERRKGLEEPRIPSPKARTLEAHRVLWTSLPLPTVALIAPQPNTTITTVLCHHSIISTQHYITTALYHHVQHKITTSQCHHSTISPQRNITIAQHDHNTVWSQHYIIAAHHHSTISPQHNITTA